MPVVDILDDVQWMGAFWQLIRSVDSADLHDAVKMEEWDDWWSFRDMMADVMETFYEHRVGAENEMKWDQRWQPKSLSTHTRTANVAALNQKLSHYEAYMKSLGTLTRVRSANSGMRTWKTMWEMYETRKKRLETDERERVRRAQEERKRKEEERARIEKERARRQYLIDNNMMSCLRQLQRLSEEDKF
jgi:hypothetical protein